MSIKPFSYYDLIETFDKAGCAVCECLKNDGERYLSALLYEYVTDPDAHQAFRAARGLCHTHSHQLLSTREGMISVAVLYEAAVDELLSVLQPKNSVSQAAGALGRLLGGNNAQALAHQLQPQAPCLCCTHLQAQEARYLDVMATGLHDDARFTQAYSAGDGVCLPHLVALLPRLKPAAVEVVIEKQREMWAKLKAELSLYVSRYGMREADVRETMGEEATSWLRAIVSLAGEDRLFGQDKQPF